MTAFFAYAKISAVITGTRICITAVRVADTHPEDCHWGKQYFRLRYNNQTKDCIAKTERRNKKAKWNIPELAQPLPIPSTQWVVGLGKG